MYLAQQNAAVPQVAGESTVVDDANHPVEVYLGSSKYRDLKLMAADLNLTIYPEDKVDAFPDPSLGLGSQITIVRATPVLVNDAGQAKIYHTWEKQISGFLTEQKIILGDKDKIEPSSDTWIRWNLNVSITRVAETEIKEQEAIDYKTVKKEDSEMAKGETRVENPGKVGKREKTYLVRRENGQEVSRELIKDEVVEQSEDRVVIYGTKIVELGRGIASWYDWISGNTAAHNSLPMGSTVRVTNVANGKSIVVKIVDRGIQTNAVIDLSADAFSQIANLGEGLISVRLTKE